MLDFVWFMLFSTIEGLAVYAFMLYIFRFKLTDYILPVLILIVLMNLQSFYMREDTHFPFVVPVINLLFSVLFMKYIVRMPLLGSVVSAGIGYVAFGLVQLLIAYSSGGYLSVEQVQTVAYKGYIIQLLTGVIGVLIAHTLYKFGIGFANDFEKYRFKWESKLVFITCILFCLAMGVVVYIGNLYILLTFFIISMMIFLYYAMRKEQEESDS
ncbi:hypothetical protein [Paenibacillus sp. JDR-2]|uniref:hypothetical protein n=1 Tax=Paenibacillus sp. (strain JDR-2) TaxID=324057 RepID=UPI000166A421|nr:hypothetical protein [Paenibacillus sp. JDR-2]ACT00243.1 conserved hypothetical protein [Paenibacillus sp. JDR-2]